MSAVPPRELAKLTARTLGAVHLRTSPGVVSGYQELVKT